MNTLFSIILILGAGCFQQSDPEPFSTISIETFQSLQKKKSDLHLLDVRTPKETATGKLKGALEADVQGKNFKQQVQKIDKSKPILVYCASGIRSKRAMEEMKKLGFTEVYSLEGGSNEWKKKGLPVEK